jgi:hypothetical protein
VRSSRRSELIAVLVIALAVLIVGAHRPRLATEYAQVHDAADAYMLPRADQAYIASLGYRSALADLIFAHVLVSYGLHFQDKRLFAHVGEYLDLVNRLDPKFRSPYWFADTLLTLQPEAPPVEFYRKARQIQERGLKELPSDQELWSAAGQFLAYLAPQYLPDPDEKKEYKRTGAQYLMRACNLVGSNENIPHHCITAANLLNEASDRDAKQQFLERLLTMIDDPEIQDLALGLLKRNVSEQAQAAVKQRQAQFQAKWRAALPHAPRVEIGALGPSFDAAACAGSQHALKPECATSWRVWSEPQGASNAP